MTDQSISIYKPLLWIWIHNHNRILLQTGYATGYEYGYGYITNFFLQNRFINEYGLVYKNIRIFSKSK